jgi:hypothetical protein
MSNPAAISGRVALACAIFSVLYLPANAFAHSAKEAEHDQRIRQLETELLALKQIVQQQQAELTQRREARSAAQPQVAAAIPASAAGKAPIQTSAIGSADTRFSFGGFVKMDMLTTHTTDGAIADSTPGRMFYMPSATPVDAGKGRTYSDFHAQFSRLWFGVDRITDTGDKVKGYAEFDFFGGGNTNVGNEKFSNGYPLTLRHAYVQWNRWLAGQTWTNMMDLGSLPESVDFVGIVDGTLFARQAQIRYSTGNWSFSLENPQTWYQNRSPAHVNAGGNSVPDITARWQRRGDWGHFSVSGMVRQLRTDQDSTTGYALSVAGSFKLGASDLLQYTVSGGPGVGRYVGFGLIPDAYIDADGSLQAQDAYAGFAAWRHDWNRKLRSTLAYSAAYIDTDAQLVGAAATERTQSWRLNLIYSPFPRLDVGAELSWAKRELSGSEGGELQRLQTTVKYTF